MTARLQLPDVGRARRPRALLVVLAALVVTQVTDLFIMGRAVSTDNKHKSLYEKYRSRPRARIVS